MKQNVSSGVFIAIIAVVVIGVIIFGWRMLFPDPNYTPINTPEAMRKYDEQMMQDRETFRRVRQQQAAGVPVDQIK